MILRSHVKGYVTTALRGDIAYAVNELIDVLKYQR
jgi:hypothetical protein